MWTTGRHLPFIQVPIVTFIQNTKRHQQVEIMNLQMHFLPVLGIFVGCWRVTVVMGIKEMLTRAPPDHQPTCFNIHDITSSQRGLGLHAASCSHWKKTGCTLFFALSLFFLLSIPLSTMIGCSYCNSKITLYWVIWTDLDSWIWPLQSLFLFKYFTIRFVLVSVYNCLQFDTNENITGSRHWFLRTIKGCKSMF